MKTLVTFLTLALFALPLPLFAMSHGDHSGMEMKQTQEPAKLGAYKKTEYWSKNKKFKVLAPMVPVGQGMAEFTIAVLGSDGAPATKAEVVSAKYFMPGMEMDLPKVQVERTEQKGQFKLRFPVTMNGFWKLELQLKQGSVSDKATLKFITK